MSVLSCGRNAGGNMRFYGRWKATHDKALERLEREQDGMLPENKPILFELVCKGLYPPTIVMKDATDLCSECRKEWWDLNPAFQHVNGVPHFRLWCLEHPDQVRGRFPEVLELIAEETLTEGRV
jgi:hypothetical protein